MTEGGPFYDLARQNPFRALLHVYDRVNADRETSHDERMFTAGLILTIASGFAFRINEKFRRRTQSEMHSHNR